MHYLSSFNPISRDYLARAVPSIFSEGVANRVSDKYVKIPTISIVDALEKEGFNVVKAMQCRSREATGREFAKHMLRFRHVDSKPTDKGLFPELVLVNSHDGLSSYRLMAGIYRLVCSNGMIMGKTYNEVRVRHQGDIIGQVIEGTYSVVKDAKLALEHADEMESIQLTEAERQIFAESAHEIKFSDSEQGKAIDPARLLTVRRYDDRKKDLFTTFNVIQENVIKGGVSGWSRDDRGRAKRTTTREVKSIDANTSLNRALWTLAEKMKELKQAA